MSPVRIVVIDDHTLFRRGITALLARVPDFEVVGEAADGFEGARGGMPPFTNFLSLPWKIPAALIASRAACRFSVYWVCCCSTSAAWV